MLRRSSHKSLIAPSPPGILAWPKRPIDVDTERHSPADEWNRWLPNVDFGIRAGPGEASAYPLAWYAPEHQMPNLLGYRRLGSRQAPSRSVSPPSRRRLASLMKDGLRRFWFEFDVPTFEPPKGPGITLDGPESRKRKAFVRLGVGPQGSTKMIAGDSSSATSSRGVQLPLFVKWCRTLTSRPSANTSFRT